MIEDLTIFDKSLCNGITERTGTLKSHILLVESWIISISKYLSLTFPMVTSGVFRQCNLKQEIPSSIQLQNKMCKLKSVINDIPRQKDSELEHYNVHCRWSFGIWQCFNDLSDTVKCSKKCFSPFFTILF